MNQVVGTSLGIARARDYCGVLRSMRVLIDGNEVGEVRYGGRLEIPLPPGVYSVQVAMDWCRSEPYEVHIREGELAEVEGGLKWRGLAWRWSLLAVFVAPWWVFVVRPAPLRLAKAGWRSFWEGVAVLAGLAGGLYLLVRLVVR